MSYRQNQQQKSPEKRFLLVFRFIRIGFFVLLGLLIIFTKFFDFTFQREYQILFGVILISYGLIRGYFELKPSKHTYEDEEE